MFGQETLESSETPDEYPTLALPRQWLRREEKSVEEDVGAALDRSAEIFQELPRRGVRNRPIQHHIMTIPGEVPGYERHISLLLNERPKQLEDTLQELMES